MIFGRHSREFARAIQRQEWEASEAGIYFPRQHALLHGHVKVETKRGVVHRANMILRHAMAQTVWDNLLLGGGTAAALDNVYIAPWGKAVNITRAWEDLVIASADLYAGDVTLYQTLGELGDAPEGYDEVPRQPWTWVDQGGGLIDNSGAPAAFTMRTASTIKVYGFALCFGAADVPTADVKRRGAPDNVYTNYNTVDLTNAFFPEILTGVSGYAPVGASVVGSGSGFADSFAVGRSIALDPTAHIANPHQGPIDNGSLAVVTHWWDPSGDDYYDADLGHWVDPSGDSLNSDSMGDPLLAIVDIPVETFDDMDPLNVTWGIQLSSS